MDSGLEREGHKLIACGWTKASSKRKSGLKRVPGRTSCLKTWAEPLPGTRSSRCRSPRVGSRWGHVQGTERTRASVPRAVQGLRRRVRVWWPRTASNGEATQADFSF